MVEQEQFVDIAFSAAMLIVGGLWVVMFIEEGDFTERFETFCNAKIVCDFCHADLKWNVALFNILSGCTGVIWVAMIVDAFKSDDAPS